MPNSYAKAALTNGCRAYSRHMRSTEREREEILRVRNPETQTTEFDRRSPALWFFFEVLWVLRLWWSDSNLIVKIVVTATGFVLTALALILSGGRPKTRTTITYSEPFKGYSTQQDARVEWLEAPSESKPWHFAHDSTRLGRSISISNGSYSETQIWGFKGQEFPQDAKVERYETTTEPETLTLARNWITTCLEEHSACQPPPEQNFVPTRLLYIDAGDILRVMHFRKPVEMLVCYTALSHCWGGNVEMALTTANYESMKDGFALKSLPRTFRDAVAVTRALGIMFIWIDSMCIIQDSESDWLRESALMMEVYANAYCTISATASLNSEGGCFRARYREVQSPFQPRMIVPSISSLFAARVEAAPLSMRAWVFQERLLSQRVLHFCEDMILFECNTLQASETSRASSKYEKAPYILVDGRLRCEPAAQRAFGSLFDPTQLESEDPLQGWRQVGGDGKISESTRRMILDGKFQDHSATEGLRGALHALVRIKASDQLSQWEQLEFNRRWYDLVSYYSQGKLTKESDKLIAIAGVAGLVEQHAKGTYMAGLWANVALQFGLLWRVLEPGERHQSDCAPSWSWASVNARVELWPNPLPNDPRGTFHARVERASVTFRGRNVERASNRVDGGYLIIDGPTIAVLPRLERKFMFGPTMEEDGLILEFSPDLANTKRSFFGFTKRAEQSQSQRFCVRERKLTLTTWMRWSLFS